MNHTTHDHQQRELLSALTDGEINSDELGVLLSGYAHKSAARADWAAYQVIGDVLRSPGSPVLGADSGFADRLSRRLALEQQQAAPAAATLPAPERLSADAAVVVTVDNRGPASNDGNFRWKMLAGFASLAAVAAVGFNTLGFLTHQSTLQLAQSPATSQPVQQVLVASPQGTMVRDARLEELLAAHKQMGATSAFQVPSGFLRNATFEAPQQAAR